MGMDKGESGTGRPGFLDALGEDERRPLSLVGWLGVAVGLALLGLLVANPLLMAGLPSLRAYVETKGPPMGPDALIGELAILAGAAFNTAILAVAIAASARLFFRRPVWTFLAPVRRPDASLLAVGLIFYLMAYGLEVVVRAGLGERFDPPMSTPGVDWTKYVYALGAPLFAALAAAGEEAAFRGVLLQLSGAATRRPLILCVVNGVLFALPGLADGVSLFASQLFLGAVLAFSVLRLGGLEFAFGGHFGALLVSTAVEKPSTLQGQSGDDPRGLFAAVAIAVVATLVVELLARRRRA